MFKEKNGLLSSITEKFFKKWGAVLRKSIISYSSSSKRNAKF